MPNNACAHKSRLPTRTLVTALVPEASPSHCRKAQPGAGVAVSVTSVLLRYESSPGDTSTKPPPAVVALTANVGSMITRTGSASHASRKFAS